MIDCSDGLRECFPWEFYINNLTEVVREGMEVHYTPMEVIVKPMEV
jgi:hypothetical protein